MAELADAPVSKTGGGDSIPVRSRSSAPTPYMPTVSSSFKRKLVLFEVIVRHQVLPTIYPKIGKYRLLFSYIIALATILVAHKPLLFYGLIFVALGALLRLWAAGYIVKRRELATGGPYAFTRNPLYLGSFVSALGNVIMVHNWPLMLVFLTGFAVFYGCTIKSEEAFLENEFGAEFDRYRQTVPVFIPRRIGVSSGFSWKLALANGEIKTLIYTALIVCLLFLAAYIR